MATDGSDAHDGLTPEKPWRTLRRAAREARAGDTVTIAPGRYAGILCPLQTGVSPDRRITFRAERPLTVVIDGGHKDGREGLAHCIEVNSKAYLTFENLTTERAYMTDYGSSGPGHRVGGQVRCYGSYLVDFNGMLLDCAVEADYNAYFWLPADHSNGACPLYAVHKFPDDPVANKPPLDTWKVGLAAWRDARVGLHSMERFQAAGRGGAYMDRQFIPAANGSTGAP